MPDLVSSRSLRNLVCIAIAIVGAAALATGLTIWGLRSDAIDDASRDIGNIATILADHTSQSVKAFDAALIGVGQHLVELHTAAPERYEAVLRSAELHEELTARSMRLPQIDTINIVSPDGRLVNVSRTWPTPETDVADRESFISLRDDATAGMHVGLPVVSRINNEKRVFFSRRIASPKGEFLGVVLLGIRLDYFNRLYSALDSADMSFLFVRDDGTVLLRYPNPIDHTGEKLPANASWYAVVAAGGGVFQAPSLVDGATRLIAARKVAGYPLVVNVTVRESASLAQWRRRAAMIAAGTVLTLLCFALLLRALIVQFRRLVASQASLAERESKLSESSRELKRANRTIDAALNNMSQGLSMIDHEGRLVICNQRYIGIYDLPPDIATPGARLVDLLAHRARNGNFEGDPEAFVAAVQVRMAQGEKFHTRSELADGRVVAVANEPMAGGGWVATHEDITERQRSQERISRMARHDALTDLANRVLFRERMEEAFVRHESTGKGYTVFVFDLDLFKAVNDSLGHPVGDALLKAVARRLQDATRETDTVGRLGGDEFAILQHAEPNQRDRAVALARRLLEVVGAPYEIDGHRVVIGISIGIAMAPEDGLDTARLLRNADLALYRAKADGRNTYRFFEQEMDEDLRLRRTLEIDLNNAVTNGEFEAYYQPLIDIETGDICAIEALIRWHHPVHGMIAPDRFIPVAEERGMITAIGRWILRQACHDAAAWPAHVRVAVNLSPVQFRNSDLTEIVSAALADSGLAPERLELEITESVLLKKNAHDISILHQIKGLGVSVVLDDFGTGYSSLSYLRLFPFDKIKIDKSFVQEMSHRADCAAIVCAITSLGRELNMVTTAEGVETAEQLELVRAAGCKLAQGFLFSQPCRVADLKFTLAQAERPLSAAG
jgi:diguanylate cyclase (GGDEF)-like protein